MNAQNLTVGVLLALFLAGPVTALTIVNEDTETHAVTVTHSDASETIEIAAGDEAEVDCSEGCTLELASGEQADFGNDDTAVISQGGFVSAE